MGYIVKFGAKMGYMRSAQKEEEGRRRRKERGVNKSGRGGVGRRGKGYIKAESIFKCSSYKSPVTGPAAPNGFLLGECFHQR